MCTRDLIVAPEVLERFKEIFEETNPDQPSLKNPMRTLLRILDDAKSLKLKEWEGTNLLEDVEGVSYYINQNCLFTVRKDPKPRLITVASAKGFIKARNRALQEAKRKPKSKMATPRVASPVPRRIASRMYPHPVATAKVPGPPIDPADLDRIHFSIHALVKFFERFRSLVNGDIEQSARKVLAAATEKQAIRTARKIDRIIRHDFKEARYFRNGDCRFVVREKPSGELTVVTIEKCLR